MGKYTKKEAASIVVNSAAKYEVELANKDLLFVCIDKHKNLYLFEFSFRRRNFLHLTGLIPIEFIDSDGIKRVLSPSEFYYTCLDKKIKTNQFEFSEDGTSQLKLEILPQMICKNLSANMLGDYDTFTPKLQTEKLVGKQTGVMGFVLDTQENVFLPNTLLKADIRNLSKSTIRIIATYRKNNDDLTYEELTYKAKNVDWDKIKWNDRIKKLIPNIEQSLLIK